MRGTLQHNYVISLTTAKERREHIIQEFGKQNIPFEFFDAITPDLIEEKSKELGIDISDTKLTLGELACAFSHITLWRLAKEKNLEYICIFEDDVYLGKDANQLLRNTYFPEKTHIIKLETYQNNLLPKIFKTKIKILGRKLFRLKNRHVGMAGYIVTKSGIDFIYSHIRKENLDVPIDDFIFERYLDNDEYYAFQMIPALCIQDFFLHKKTNFKSYLDEERAIRCNNNGKKKKKTIIFRIYRELTRPIYKGIYKGIYKLLNGAIPFK